MSGLVKGVLLLVLTGLLYLYFPRLFPKYRDLLASLGFFSFLIAGVVLLGAIGGIIALVIAIILLICDQRR